MSYLTSKENISLTGSIKCLIVLLIFLLITTESYAAAFCALRDPTNSISDLFPDYKSSRSLIKNISDNAKKRLQEHLPFEFHYKEFGEHTLYLVFSDKVPIGLIHTRPEKGQWGINEIVWALDMDFNIIGFRFQRCRCITKDEVESTKFKQFLQGKNWETLSEILLSDTDKLNSFSNNMSDEGRSLAMMVIRSAIKASLTTSLVWGKELHSVRQVSSPSDPSN